MIIFGMIVKYCLLQSQCNPFCYSFATAQGSCKGYCISMTSYKFNGYLDHLSHYWLISWYGSRQLRAVPKDTKHWIMSFKFHHLPHILVYMEIKVCNSSGLFPRKWDLGILGVRPANPAPGRCQVLSFPVLLCSFLPIKGCQQPRAVAKDII